VNLVEAPIWAEITKKPLQSLDVEPVLVDHGITPVETNKQPVIVVLAENEQTDANNKDEDDEGFTVVKSKKDSKVEEKYVQSEAYLCIESNYSMEKTKNTTMTTETTKQSTNVLDSLENIMRRPSETRKSLKKRKHDKSRKSTEELPDLIDPEDKLSPTLNRKSREVFDYYVNAIDGDTTSSESQVPVEDNEKQIKVSSEKTKSDEYVMIENLLNSIPKDKLPKNKSENIAKISQNGNVTGKFEEVESVIVDENKTEENEKPACSSNHTSGTNTLKRSWKRQNSKKKRNSKHVL